MPTSLPIGTVLGGCYQIVLCLEEGATGWVYEAQDLQGDERFLIWEFSLANNAREGLQIVQTERLDSERWHRLKWSAFDMHRRLRLVRSTVHLPIAQEWMEHGTTYAAIALPTGIEPACAKAGWSPGQFQAALLDFLSRLAPLHELGVRAGDFRIEHFYCDRKGNLYSQRGLWIEELCGDVTGDAASFKKGFAPEQREPIAPRGPWTDLYNLALAFFSHWVGRQLDPEVDRAELLSLQLNLDPRFGDLIQRMLNPDPYQRFRSAKQALDYFNEPRAENTAPDWRELDRRVCELQKLKPKKRQCPACDGLLKILKPAKEGSDFFSGKPLNKIQFEDRACPVCKVGVLKSIENKAPLRLCPSCHVGWLWQLKLPSLVGSHTFRCESCQEEYKERGGLVTSNLSEVPLEWDELRRRSGRSDCVLTCDHCRAQLDEMSFGYRQLIRPERVAEEITFATQREWAAIALSKYPGCGNAMMGKTEYHLDSNGMMLLRSEEGNHPWELSWANHEQSQWIAAGKTSGNAGAKCIECELEFDTSSDERLKLVNPGNSVLGQSASHRLGAIFSLPDWHRVLRELPLDEEENLTLVRLEEEIIRAWCAGEIGEKVFWESEAKDQNLKKCRIKCSQDGVSYRRGLKRESFSWSKISAVSALQRDQIIVTVRDEERLGFEVPPMSIGLELESGWRTIELCAFDLAERCNRILSSVTSGDRR